MTPVLVKAFGQLRAVQIAHDQTPTDYHRTSQIIQSDSKRLVLDATLTISKASLSIAAIDALMTTEILFGQLLLEHDIKVELVGMTIFRRSDDRFGRRTDMFILGTTARLAQVEETLVSDSELVEMISDSSATYGNS
jgi:hypothetical protein